jgi:hypothetical protein
MLDSSNNIRNIYINALNGNISYGGKNVPVYGQQPFSTTPQNYIVISSITEVAVNTNNSFGNSVDVVIDIFSEQYRTYENSIVDNISSQILNILIPDTQVNGFSDTFFEVYPTQRTSSSYLPIIEGQNFIARKIISISNLVNQK